MTSSASSLHFLALTPSSLSLPTSKPAAVNLFSLKKTLYKSASISRAISFQFKASPSRFVLNVAVSSEFEQEEDLFSDPEERPSFSPDLKLFVGNLPFSADSASLAELFERAGNVEMVEVIYDKITGRSRGFGFVTMSTAEEVEAAVQQFNGYELDGRPLRVNSGPPPRKSESSFRGYSSTGPPPRRSESPFGGSRSRTSLDNNNRLYVGNLSWGVDDSGLASLFSEQGKVVEAKVVYDRDSGRSKGFGFVTYSSADEANNAIESLDGADLDGRTIRVSMAEARSPRRQF